MKKLTALVTGGAGFIGSHIVDQLLSLNVNVRVIDNLSGGTLDNLSNHESNPDLIFYDKDITTLTNCDKYFNDVDWVFHLAGIGDIVPSIENPISYYKTNAYGTALVAEASRKAGVKKVVYAASSSCYGLAEVPTNELNRLDPMYPYALTKLLGEQTLMHWHKVYGLPVNSIRIFNAYGPRSKTTGAYGAVFGVFLRQKIANKPLTVVGDGSQSRDFVYATDVANAFILAAQSERVGEIYNVGNGKPKTIKELSDLISDKVVFIPERPGEPECTWADINKIQTHLGWSPKIALEEGVALMMSQIAYWKNAPLWDADKIENATKEWFKFLGNNSSDKV